MKNLTRALATLTVLTLCMMPSALAESLSFTGSVTASRTVEVYAPIGGTVESIDAQIGEHLSAGDAICTLSTDKVYATEDGTVTGIFGQPGDDAETIGARYGAVMYIEGESVYSIAASTENAYNDTDNKFVHTGEKVYLNCYSDSSHSGWGIITAIQGTDYTVEVTSGEFIVGETVSVYRGDSAVAANRIGRGELTRINPTAVTAQGSIVSIAVEDGLQVHRGDLLFETLSGSFDGLYMSGDVITAPSDGTVYQLNVQQGSMTEKDSVVAVLYPDDAMRIEAQVNEGDLGLISVGDAVNIELIWNQDEEVRYQGTISSISAVASSSSAGGAEGEVAASVSYTVCIDFTPDADTRYGMSAVITTVDDEEESEDEEIQENLAEADEPASIEDATGDMPDGKLQGFPEGMSGELPEGFGERGREGLPEGFPENMGDGIQMQEGVSDE